MDYETSKKTKKGMGFLESPTYWKQQLEASRRYLRTYRQRANRMYDRFEQDNEMSNNSLVRREEYMPRSNILWANTKIEAPTLYSRVPKPVCTVKWDHSNQITSRAAELIEQNTAFEVEESDRFDTSMRECIQDLQLSGRGVVRVTYDFDTQLVEEEIPVFPDNITGGWVYGDGSPVPPDKEVNGTELGRTYFILEQVEKITNERIDYEYIQFDHFNHSVSRKWERVKWVSFDNYLTRDEVAEKFGEKVASKLTYSARAEQETEDEAVTLEEDIIDDDANNRALVVEIWDKKARKVRFFSPCYPEEFLLVTDPPFNVPDFFPCPKPLYANKTNRSLIGRPDFIYYEAHVNELRSI